MSANNEEEPNNSVVSSKEMADSNEDDGENLNYGEWNGVDQMESMCMRCGESGLTRLMLHKIPYFRELIIASFACEYCGERNNEVTFGGEIQLQGCSVELKVTTERDLDRQLIKSDSATVRIRELDFEIPPMTQKGEISTIEGILRTAAKNLSMYQAERMAAAPEVGAKVAEIILSLSRMASGDFLPFTLVVDDPAGNSFVENIFAPTADPNMTYKHYFRSAAQDEALGLQADKGLFRDDKESNFKSLMGGNAFGAIKTDAVGVSNTGDGAVSDSTTTAAATSEEEGSVRLGRSEVISIPSNCPNCNFLGESLTALTDIPHFKEVIIMAFDCKQCGFRNNEVKGGGAVPNVGTEVRLTVCGPDDLKRDVLKSDCAGVSIPELDLELSQGTLGGLFTTVEGLIMKIHKNLLENNPFSIGDSTTKHHSADGSVAGGKQKFDDFMRRLSELGSGKQFPFTLILRDPLGNSFISAPLGSFLPPELDKNLQMINFVRTWEENEELGLNDINTKDFETGVDHESEILPDRVTSHHVKGPDHPTLFAKGTTEHDNTTGGVFFKGTASATTAAVVGSTNTGANDEEEDEPYFEKPPAGWVAAKNGTELDAEDLPELESPSVVMPVGRSFNDDSALKFDPREEWGGARVGWVFRLGSQGLGYYEDSKQLQKKTESASVNAEESSS